MTEPTPQWVANRAQALIAYINGEPDADAWLESTGLERPHQVQVSQHQNRWVPCWCPYCQHRPIDPKGDLGRLITREPRNHLQ